MANNGAGQPAFDKSTLRELAELTDGDGVLSVYVTVDPREENTARPGWQIRVDNQLAEIRKHVDSSGDRAYAKRVLRRFDEVRPEIDQILEAREHWRGRALFASMNGGDPRVISVQLPLLDLVVFQPRAHIRPLLEVTEVGAPAGILTVARAGVRMVDLRFGHAQEVGRQAFEVRDDDWRQMRGPGPVNPEMSRPGGASQRDRFAKRVDEQVVKLVRTSAAEVENTADKLAWESIVVTGDPKLVEPFVGALTSNDRRPVLALNETLEHSTDAELADVVMPKLNAARSHRAEQLAVAAKDAAFGGGAGAVGLSDVLVALREGAVDHLFLDATREWEGVRSEDGLVYATDQVPPDVEAKVPEPWLGEWMIAAALRTDGRVTMLDSGAAEPLAAYEGVAAQLRW